MERLKLAERLFVVAIAERDQIVDATAARAAII